jgi:SAM-dependent methyltransferase
MALGWINLEDYAFNSFLLLERFQIHMMFRPGRDDKWRRSMGIALNANPAVRWYLERRCPARAEIIAEIAAEAPSKPSAHKIRKAEIYALECAEDFVTFTTPEVMGTNCHYIRAWDKERLFEMAQFEGKVVLDVGSGSGRLAFAAAERAKEVYASEPVGTLREFIREKAAREGVTNIRVAEALVTDIPYPDDTFDIVMSGHVVGDDWDAEVAELTRVCKPGGWLLDCPGDETGGGKRHEKASQLTERGWEVTVIEALAVMERYGRSPSDDDEEDTTPCTVFIEARLIG